MTMEPEKNVVTFGAGTGQRMLLSSLRDLPISITAVTNVTDNGGHTGKIRKEYGLPAIGDTRNCLSILSHNSDLLTELLSYRYPTGSLEGVQLGNLVLTALTLETHSLSESIQVVGNQLLENEHRVLPVSDESGQIGCVLENGNEIIGEWEIIQRDDPSPIREIFHKPELSLTPGIEEEVRAADAMIIAPGNLQTGVLSCLNTGRLPEIIAESTGQLIFICNLLNRSFLTPDYNAGDHLKWIEKTVGRNVDVALVSTGTIPEDSLQAYKEEDPGTTPVHPDGIPDRVQAVKDRFSISAEKLEGEKGIRAGREQFKASPKSIRHDPNKLRDHLVDLILESPSEGS